MDDALRELGWSVRWEELFAPHVPAGGTPGRVIRTDRGGALVATRDGVVYAKPSARLRKVARDMAERPAVGDWVAVLTPDGLDIPLVEAVLPRTSAIVRGDPGQTGETQVLAANIDTVFIVHPIAAEPNLRRIERELALAWDSGAEPVVVLSKADLCPDPDAARAAVASVAGGVDVLLTSARDEESIAPLRAYTRGGRTAVLVGPSGAGKSTLVNRLLGEDRQATREVRVSDARGRHTTVSRELIRMPDGGLLIDTPGLRALGLTGSESGIAAAFADVEELAPSCRFRDCTHREEPDCAVRAAVAAGDLPVERLESYLKLMREAEVAAARSDARLRAEEERRSKALSRAVRNYNRDR